MHVEDDRMVRDEENSNIQLNPREIQAGLSDTRREGTNNAFRESEIFLMAISLVIPSRSN